MIMGNACLARTPRSSQSNCERRLSANNGRRECLGERAMTEVVSFAQVGNWGIRSKESPRVETAAVVGPCGCNWYERQNGVGAGEARAHSGARIAQSAVSARNTRRTQQPADMT